MRKLYLQGLFFYVLGVVGVLYIFAFFVPALMWAARVLLFLLLALTGVDVFLLFRQGGLDASRVLPDKLSNGDDNPVKIRIKSRYPFGIRMTLIDEAPFQFQLRTFEIRKVADAFGNLEFQYILKPRERGEYSFGKLNIFVRSPLGLISKRFIFDDDATLSCYPSFIHLQKYELIALHNEFLLGGIKKIRRVGHTMEFEQIHEYANGDDIRTINWKATGKRSRLMVNQYQEERAQRVYMVIDKGRTMQMPFDGLSLLDYSINAAMALSHIILKKQDRAGLMTFSKQIENTVTAELKAAQIKRIADVLFNIKTNFYESDFGRLYTDLRHRLNQRSLLLLFTNFETLDSLKRQLKYLRAIAQNHLLVVVFFKNSEIVKMVEQQASRNTLEVYDEIIAEKFEYEKLLIRQELQKFGIMSIYTLPENLSIQVINKYLEIKSRGLL